MAEWIKTETKVKVEMVQTSVQADVGMFGFCGSLWSPYVMGQSSIFLPCGFFLLFFLA